MTKGKGWEVYRQHFLPEESFRNWESYSNAMWDVGSRFRDRLFTRSTIEVESTEVRARSEHEMKKTLNWWDLIWFGIGSVIGAGIFVLTGLEAKEKSGPAILLSYVISGISVLLCVFNYTEFAVEFPIAGGSFAYLRVELGDFVAFVAAGNTLFEGTIGGAAVARSWTAYFATLCNQKSNAFRIHTNLSEDYSELDPIAVAVLIITGLIVIKSTKVTAKINSIASVFHVAILVFIIIAGLTQADASNYSDFMPYGVRGIFTSAATIYFAYLGFDTVATLAEETKNPKRDIPIGLIGSMLIIIAIYCFMALTLCLMQYYKAIDPDAAFSSVFTSVGMNWAKYIVALGALEGMTTVLMVGVIGSARYLTHIARTHMFPPWFALVNEKTGTPINATVIMISANSVVAFFTDLHVLSNLLSISTLFIFCLVATALLVRRYYVSGETSVENQRKLILFLVIILGSSAATSVYWATSDGWIGYVITVPILFLGTLGLKLFVPMARTPKLWGVPYVPWLPSLSIGVNVFLLGSIDKDSFIRFAVWTAIIVVYYIFIGLHATYDTAKAADTQRMAKHDNLEPQLSIVEGGNEAPK
eukprot:PITA_00835